LSKVLKAQNTSFKEQAYYVQVEPIRKPVPPVIDEERHEVHSEAEQILAKARREAELILRQAEEQAAMLLAQERMRVESILQAEREEAKRFGYEAGYGEAVQAVEADYASRLDHAEKLIQSALEERQLLLEDAQPMIVELACAIARKIMTRECTVDREWVLGVVRAALEEIRDAGNVEVRVNPDDYELVRANAQGLRKEVPGQSELLVIPDRGVEAGGCVIQTSFGNIDARLDTQLEEVRKALHEVAGSLEP
jgi:flagellar assembly protein FliH